MRNSSVLSLCVLSATACLAVFGAAPTFAAEPASAGRAATVSAQPWAVQAGPAGDVQRLNIGAGEQAAAGAQAPLPAEVLASAKCADSGTKAFRQEVLKLTNNYRAIGRYCGSTWYAATKPLAWSTELKRAANGHSRDMAKNNFFSHTGSNGSSMADRITDAGYRWSSAGENIAAGYDSVASVMDGWIKSPGHCANIMSSHYKDIGMACVPSTSADYSSYWTMDLAAPL
ncbi:CAP domain-containing protein [Ideonella sp. DXS29W]|uniref:CAP domain-containing protein n=1 Tax=Ideonella lacteola TaxID=2984193 RepID=A0ABU9BVN8_9BURK